MLPEANSCGPISGNPGREAITEFQNQVFAGMAVGLLCTIASLLMTGCSSSSPRFVSVPLAGSPHDEEDETRFATRIRAEEEDEDDRKVDVEKVRRQLTPENTPNNAYANRTPAGLDRDRLLLDVVSFLGTPYRRGGNTKEGIDCSGFTAKVYERATATQLPRSAKGQFGVGLSVTKKNLEFGDLVFFNTTGRRPSHVGIYIEDDLFAHASVTRGVTLSSLESTYYRKRFVGARRVVSPYAPPPGR